MKIVWVKIAAVFVSIAAAVDWQAVQHNPKTAVATIAAGIFAVISGLGRPKPTQQSVDADQLEVIATRIRLENAAKP